MNAYDPGSAKASAPATRTKNFNPDASEPETFPAGATVYVGTAGDVALHAMRDPGTGNPTIFANVPAGSFLPVAVKTLFGAAEGTTASDLVVMWNP